MVDNMAESYVSHNNNVVHLPLQLNAAIFVVLFCRYTTRFYGLLLAVVYALPILPPCPISILFYTEQSDATRGEGGAIYSRGDIVVEGNAYFASNFAQVCCQTLG